MKKLLGTLVLLILLGFVAYFMVFQKGNSTFDIPETAFTIKDSQKIDKIIITDWEGKKRNLQRFEGTEAWTTEGRYVVRHDIIKVVLETLENIRVYAPVSNAALANVEKSMKERSTKVEIYSKNKLLKKIYMAGPVPGGMGDYMQLEGESKPYITHIPGFNGYLSRRFFIDIEEWRSREAFNYPANQIKSIQLEYPAQMEHSFEIEQTGDQILVKSLRDNSISESINLIAAKSYLGSFENIHIESYHNDYSKKDSLLANLEPLCKMKLTTKKNKVTEIDIYPMLLNERSKMMFDRAGNPLKFDRDHYQAVLNEGRDFAVVQDYVFGNLFRKYGDFVGK